jgi:hypothetical protein
MAKRKSSAAGRLRPKSRVGKVPLIAHILVGVIVGLAIAIPASYYFQSGLVRAFVSLPDYTMRVLKGVPAAIGGGSSSAPASVTRTLLLTIALVVPVCAYVSACFRLRR